VSELEDKDTVVMAFRLRRDQYNLLLNQAKPNESRSNLMRRVVGNFIRGNPKRLKKSN